MIFECWAGPGVGKTTVAHFIFASLKEIGVNVEFVPEIAKHYAYQKTLNQTPQIVITGEQLKQIHQTYPHVDFLVMDHSLLQGVLYAPDPHYAHALEQIITHEQQAFKIHPIWIERALDTSNYQQTGRMETLSLAQHAHQARKQLMSKHYAQATYVNLDQKDWKHQLILDLFKVINQTK